ncbi:MAG TPA: SCO family protein [Pyrinomonadaceae bacterium]|nr:SCO family protein [Pyrinomonadaceae bacterium]
MLELQSHDFCGLVEHLSIDELIALLHEDNHVYDQRGATTVVRMRGWVMLTLARTSLPDAALPFILEDLDTGVDAYLVATAAVALRAYSTPNSAFAPFVVRAITNIRYRDERVSLDTFGGFAIGAKGTSPVRELLTTLAWLGPHARASVSEIETLRTGPTALSKKYHADLDQILATISDQATEATDCCDLPAGVKDLFSWMRPTRTTSSSIESTVFEDQNGSTVTFGEYFHGRPSIVVFFYTRCDNPLKCSLTITKLARIQTLLEAEGLADQINTAGITYDPGFDLPERILNYGQHRGVQFAPQHRLLRTQEGLEALRKHFALGVNFIESLVNRHRIELYILDANGQTAGYFGRVQWNEREVVERAMGLLKEKNDGGSRFRAASPVFGTAVALGLALFPKCPFCWAAYLSLFGIAGLESIPYSPWLQPVLAIFLLSNLTSVWFRARATHRMIPFYFVTAGAIAIIASKAFAGPDAFSLFGVLLTLVGSVWSTLNRTLLKRRA